MSSFDLEPSIVSFNSAIRGSSWSMALQLLRQSLDRKLQATTVTYNSAGTQQSYGENAKSQWFFALELLDQLSQKWISSDQLSLTAVMASCQNQWQLVLQLMRPDGSESNDLDVISYTTAINSCGAAKQWERALSFFNEMSNQLVPNRISFGAVISACEKASEWTWAVHLLELAEPLKPNEIICSAVISACEKSSRWEVALFLLRSLNRLTLETTSESYNPVISACSGSQWQLAWELFQQMPTMRLSPDSFSYTAIMKACGQGSQWQTALVFLESPLSSSEGDQSSDRSIFWNAAINACTKGIQWRIALDLFDQLQVSELSETSFGAAISACAEGSNWQMAMNFLQMLQLHEVVPSIISYSAAITSCGAEWERALDLLESMIRKELLPNVITYNSMISACEKGSQWQLALQIFFQSMEDIEVDSILYSSVIATCGSASEWLIALKLFHQSQFSGGNEGPSAETISAAITACERGCQWQYALEMLQIMLRMQLDDVTSSSAYGTSR